MKIKTLEEAQKRIKELEKEVAELKAENERLLGSMGGRRKHDEKWMASFNEFAIMYKDGLSIAEIVDKGDISRRTAYRYLAYLKELDGEKK
ncbi:MAG: helix-turn-helix domain-containing protein [Lachnospiraceae bacterium]|nr:helix-turn-helix domain-containing protein [Lachnospiraceae bacterium]